MVSEGQSTYSDTLLYILCLNPCSCGGWSQRQRLAGLKGSQFVVLILVLVEDGLRESECNVYDTRIEAVLILVLVEDGLRAAPQVLAGACACGVLILVLVEDGLRDGDIEWETEEESYVLILVLVEDGLREWRSGILTRICPQSS